MSHYSKVAEFFDIDESNWDFILRIAEDRLGKNKDKYSEWVRLEKRLKEEYPIGSENENIGCFAEVVLPAERSYISDKREYKGLCDCELVGHYARVAEKDEDFGSPELCEILDSMGTVCNNYINYYDLFLDAVLNQLTDINAVQKILVKLSKIYTEDILIIQDIMCAFAMTSIVNGKVKKGLAIFDSIAEEDEFNLLIFSRAAQVLHYCEEYDLEARWLEKAISVAEELDRKNIAEMFRDQLNEILVECQQKPYEPVTEENVRLSEIIDNPSEYENYRKILLDLIMSEHPDLSAIIYYSQNQAEIDKAYKHIREHASMCEKVLFDNETKEKFRDLLKTKREHEAIHILMEEN